MSKEESRPVMLSDGRIVKLSMSDVWPAEEFVDGKWVPFEDDDLTVGAVWDSNFLSDDDLKKLNIKI